MMIKLIGSSSLIAFVSIFISLVFLFVFNDASSFAKFALLQINQAYCITLNYSLFYIPMFSDIKNRKLLYRKSMLQYCFYSNFIYSLVVFVFFQISIGDVFSSLVCALYVFFIGIRAALRNFSALKNNIHALSTSDFIFSIISLLSLITSYIYGFTFHAVVSSLILGCFSSILYLSYCLGACFFRPFLISRRGSYIKVLRKHGPVNVITSIISDLNSNLYAYFLPIFKGHESIVLPSFLVMCFRPFNLAMTSKEEYLRSQLLHFKKSLQCSYFISFFRFSFLILIFNFFLIAVLFMIPDFVPQKIKLAYGFDDCLYLVVILFLIFTFRILKQILIVYMQITNNGIIILIAALFPFLVFYSLFCSGLLNLSLFSSFFSMLLIEINICVFLFFIFWRLRVACEK